MVTVIIPAYNEEETIGEVVGEASGHPLVREIIVVDDASTDATARVARERGARVITLQKNVGKAGAMEEGVKAAATDIVLFLDADVTGMNHEKISLIADPVVEGRLDMHVGIFDRPTLLTKKFFYVLPVLSGLRALTKEIWYKVPAEHKKGFRIEIALNHAARKWGKGTGYEIVTGLKHLTKEKKFGLWRGFSRRVTMILEIIDVSIILYVYEPIKGVWAVKKK
jgi:polyprenyl-phospho-N-acetylgalactosaminyl synthase